MTPKKGKKRRRLRLVVQCAALGAAVILALPVFSWEWCPLVLPSLSPYVLVGSAIAARAVGVATLVGLPVLLIVLVRRRWFCRNVCPVGLMTEQVGRLRRTGRSWTRRLPPLGKWIVLVTLGGACFGYPLLLWMDPLAIFQGVFTLFHDPLSLAGRASAGALAIILGMSLLLPGAWCLRICPLGATQEIVALPRRFRTWGTLLACPKPKGTLETCPTRSVSRARTFQTLLPRRSVLSAGVGAVCMGLGARWALDLSTPAVRRRKRPLRPPGAIDERRFPGLCVRCGNCVRACPVGIIKADAASGSVAGFLAPVVDFEEDYCREDCLRCTQVCPSGAITRIAIEDKAGAPIGLAVLEASLCLLADDRECDVCARVCPFEAIKIVWNEEEYIALPQVDAQKCPGCGACEVACPGKNDWEREHADEPIPVRKAIEVHPRNVS